MDKEKTRAFSQAMSEYKKQLEKGTIKEAYNGLMDYMTRLRSYFEREHPKIPVSGSAYYGFMDMTYFALFPASLKKRKLKVAVVFLHEQFRFEVWLAGVNKTVQKNYWRLFEESNWKKYTLPQKTRATDSILEHILADNPTFDDLKTLTKQIENGTLEFIKEVTSYLANH
jgi:hypothetical protein